MFIMVFRKDSRLGNCRILHAQQPAYTDSEKTAQGNKLVDVRDGRVGLPFGDGLPGNIQPGGQSHLGEFQLFAFPGDPLTDGQVFHSFSSFCCFLGKV